MRIFLLLMLMLKGLFAIYDGDYRAYKEGCLYGYDNKLENLAMAYIRGMEQAGGFDSKAFNRLCGQVGKTGKYISQIEFEKQVYGKYVHMRKPLVECEAITYDEKKFSLAKTRKDIVEVKQCNNYGTFMTYGGKAITSTQECQYYQLLQTYQTSKGDAVLVSANSGGITPNSFQILWAPIIGQPTLVDIDYPLALNCKTGCDKPRTKQIGDIIELSCGKDRVIFQNGKFTK